MGSLHTIALADPAEPARPRHLAYWQWGDAGNPDVVVCVHGLSRNGRDFDTLAQALSSRFRVICPDMAGRGKSDWLTNKMDYTYGLYAADCFALLHALALTRVSWVGTSMGGIIGMMLAATTPNLMQRMVFNDVGSVVSAEGLKRILAYVGTSSVFKDAHDAMTYLKSVMAPFGISSEEQWQTMFAASLIALPDGRFALAYDPEISKPFRDTVSAGGEVIDVDLSAFWDKITCPVLVLRGEHSDILSRPTTEHMLTRAAPTKLVEIKNAGHAPALLDATQVEMIVNWLSQSA